MSKKTIAIFTTGEGHASIAEAIESGLESKYKIKIFFDEDFIAKIYLPFYKYFPSLFKIPFKISSFESSIKAQHRAFHLRYQKKIKGFIQKNKPDLLLSTYFMYNSTLEKLQNINKTPFVNVITDPRTPHPISIADKAKINFTFDKNLEKNCKKNYPKASYQKVGWFVRSQFEEEYDQKKVRKKLNLDQDKFTLLIVSGSEGTNLVLKVLPTLLFTDRPIQIIVSCGNNQILYKNIRALQKLLKKTNPFNTLIPLGFTFDIHHYMQAADLIVGKAGPNMLFEAVATETPFFAITHISGQEDGNLDIIREYNLGYVEENLIKAQKVLGKILAKPEQLNKFKKDILKLKKYNQQAKEKLLKLITDLV